MQIPFMRRNRPAGRRKTAFAVLCLGLLPAACQTMPRNQGVVAGFAQNRGWNVDHVTPAAGSPYCIAYRRTAGDDLTFIATTTHTGVALSRVGAPMRSGTVYDFNISFDGGQTRSLKSKPGDGMLVAPLGDANIGKHLARFASASYAVVSAPALGLRQRYDLDGSTWAINKTSECIHGAPARFPRAASAQKTPPTAAPPTAGPLQSAPPGDSPFAAPPAASPSVGAPSAGNQTGGVDLDAPQGGVDLD